ncbi:MULTISPECIES: RNA polymerase sporulation sigma factor SigK [unclassified Thomasclavelia]|uniref:RNA polymerase sporulation sigma factor SigK n=1 Tax=unclassified Thomasclavelia TaxID=3025756 RepID=UPI000B383AE7|nr:MULTISPECIES: RNA polymerase sporulation sigma factor SigK [unclassified Thomasclavelia]OUP79013.1 RNA polymerase subunit sigma-70 [Erysipelatoclostridium sp. An173]
MFSMLLQLLTNGFFLSYIKSKSFELPLSAKEEEKYLERFFNGDQDARNVLIERNLRLVAHIAKKYENSKDLQEDLISIGTIGLIKAVDSYKQNHKTKLATYASRCIENEILMHLRTNKKTSLDVSLNETIGIDKDGSEIVLGDILSSNQEEFIDIVDRNDTIDKFKTYFNILDGREKDTLIMRYGLNNTKKYTQKEIAKKLNISRSYVSRLEKRALIKLLREYMKEKP